MENQSVPNTKINAVLFALYVYKSFTLHVRGGWVGGCVWGCIGSRQDTSKTCAININKWKMCVSVISKVFDVKPSFCVGKVVFPRTALSKPWYEVLRPCSLYYPTVSDCTRLV